MATESGHKKEVTSGTISFYDRLRDPVLISVPVAEAKSEEAKVLMEDIYEVMRRHYLRSEILNPLDVARCAGAVAGAWETNQIRITTEKYNPDKDRR